LFDQNVTPSRRNAKTQRRVSHHACSSWFNLSLRLCVLSAVASILSQRLPHLLAHNTKLRIAQARVDLPPATITNPINPS
jgi:hypothetical protein